MFIEFVHVAFSMHSQLTLEWNLDFSPQPVPYVDLRLFNSLIRQFHHAAVIFTSALLPACLTRVTYVRFGTFW